MFAYKHACCIKSPDITGDKILHVKIGSTCNIIQTDMHVTIIDMHVTFIDNH